MITQRTVRLRTLGRTRLPDDPPRPRVFPFKQRSWRPSSWRSIYQPRNRPVSDIVGARNLAERFPLGVDALDRLAPLMMRRRAGCARCGCWRRRIRESGRAPGRRRRQPGPGPEGSASAGGELVHGGSFHQPAQFGDGFDQADLLKLRQQFAHADRRIDQAGLLVAHRFDDQRRVRSRR